MGLLLFLNLLTEVVDFACLLKLFQRHSCTHQSRSEEWGKTHRIKGIQPVLGEDEYRESNQYWVRMSTVIVLLITGLWSYKNPIVTWNIVSQNYIKHTWPTEHLSHLAHCRMWLWSPCDHRADWELQAPPLPSIIREDQITCGKPRKSSKFKVPRIVSTECLLLLHQHKVKNLSFSLQAFHWFSPYLFRCWSLSRSILLTSQISSVHWVPSWHL
jgi:hypothetical protein